jgi:hypothetical protein
MAANLGAGVEGDWGEVQAIESLLENPERILEGGDTRGETCELLLVPVDFGGKGGERGKLGLQD